MSAFKFILVGLVVLYIAFGFIMFLFQEKLIFLPVKLPSDYTYSFETDFEEYFIAMEDGAEVNALHFRHPKPKGLIVYFHGNAGSLARWGQVVLPFVALGYEVLIYDYRGYGKSTGKRSKQKLLSDASTVYSFATELTSEKQIILFGRSLGSAFASHLAGLNHPKKVILETPFYSLEDVTNRILPIYPTSLLLRYKFQNHTFLTTNVAPVYIFHGTEDEVVPYESGKRLFRSLNENTHFFTIEGGHHNDLDRYKEYWTQMKIVLDE